MAVNKSTQLRGSTTLPPRNLNVQKFAESRASELEALHSIVADRLNNDFRSRRNKRRRTTGYDNRGAKNRFRKKQKTGVVDESNDNSSEINKKRPPRCIRRKIELKKNPERGFCTSGDGTKRLRTHVWHAKRFTMTKFWGFHLPLGLHGRGRGSRAVLKWLKHGAVVHDASYSGAVQLEGPEDLLFSTLRAVLTPAPSKDFPNNVLSGAIYGKAMLHHVGARFSHIIAPVTYLWRPSHNIDGCDDPMRIEGSSSTRQVWVWIHAAAFTEGYEALKSACQMQMAEDGTLINCVSLEGELAKLEVMGSKVSELLKKIIHPVTRVSQTSWELKKCSVAEADVENQVKDAPLFENEDNISSSAIIYLTVNDPRISTKEDEVKGHQTLEEIPENKTVTQFGSMDLWDAGKGIYPPVEESVLCMEKHQQRLAFFFLGDKNSGESNALRKGQCSRFCPIILLRNNNLGDSITSWSIILPLSWVKAFWIPLVSNGAHAVGLREKHWISCEAGLPYFPSDFPDCSAHSCFKTNEAASSDEKAKLRPPSMRAFRVPIQLPWECVHSTLSKKSIRVGDCQSNLEELCAKNKANCPDVPFEGFVARTSHTLTNFLSKINGDHLLLFPNMHDKTKCISKFMKDEGMHCQGPNGAVSLINYGKKLCFLRVLLHAYKEGAFEEGAVVCAPHLTDIALWTSRSENKDAELQIAQSSLASYFVEHPSSGKWELQEPDDPAAKESHRWPIGFVTTGFVRGSKKPAAVALCEAVLLARLREEQWNAVPVKKRRKEVYVLVRNLRSTAYRLARASIVLEHQEEDLDYM
ncbi:hypothetical protein LguiA_013226 [Lonicera macranthoides]